MGRRQVLRALAAFSAALFLTAAAPSGLPQARVQRVIDGDTVVLENGRHVRLIGINAPEYEPWKKIIQPYGKEAKEFLTRLIDGKTVEIEEDVEKTDKYGRALAYLWLPDGRMANVLVVREGLARARYYKPNGAHRQEFSQEEKAAKAAQKGVWSDEHVKIEA